MERVSRNVGVERIYGRVVVVPLDVVTNMWMSISHVFCYYPGWRVAISEYAECTWKFVALRDVCPHVPGWAQSQDPNRHRSERGGDGWRNKVNQLEKANRALGDINADLMRPVDQASADANEAHAALRRKDVENARMFDDITGMRRNLNDARTSDGRVGTLMPEIDTIRADRDRLRTRLDESERENHSLLRELVSRRRRCSPSDSRIPSPKRR